MKIFLPIAKGSYAPFRKGFTLLEMSLVLLVLAVFATMFLSARITAGDAKKAEETKFRMQKIRQAMIDYRRTEHTLPCPADSELTVASANYGMAAATTGDCTGGTPAATRSGTDLAIGAVPIQDLGLSEEFMYDGWGRRFTYAVDTRAVAACSFTTYALSDATIGFTVVNSDGRTVLDNAWYAVVSHGTNGHGAYLPSGARMTTASTNAQELNNCDCDADGVDTAINNQFVERSMAMAASKTNRFDDIVQYAGRFHLRSTEDETGVAEVCP